MAKGTFARDLERFAKKTKLTVDQVHRGVVLELFSSVVRDTPVDTGRARANWLPAANTARTETVEWPEQGAKAMATTRTLAEIENVARDAKAGDVTIMTNNLPYIGRLEEGSSTQAPQGMVRRNVDRVRANLKRIINKARGSAR